MISVIVPFKNSELWIGRCLDSLHKQNGDLEFLIVDDCSTDAGREIAEKYADSDKRFKVLSNEHSAGVSGARNTGLDHASGEWVTFLDADDEMLPKASDVFDRMTRINDTANILQANHLRYYAKSGRTALKYTNARGVYNLDRLPECWCMVWNKLIRKSFLKENNIRFIEGLQYGEDEVFNFDMYSKDERIFHTLTHTVTTMRHFDNSESLSHIKGMDELMIQARALEDFIQRTDNPRARVAACKVLSEHWGSPRYLSVFGGKA